MAIPNLDSIMCALIEAHADGKEHLRCKLVCRLANHSELLIASDQLG